MTPPPAPTNRLPEDERDPAKDRIERLLTGALRGLIAACCAALTLVFQTGAANAQTCALDGLPTFAGHQLPLQSVPQLTTMTLVDAFPLLPTFSAPLTALGAPGDGSNRLFVTTLDGLIYVFPNDPTADNPILFADLSAIVQTDFGEQGLLGLAFDPDFSTNRRLYLNYTADLPQCASTGNDGCTQIARYEASIINPNQIDQTTAQVLLEFDQPGSFHNAGMLAFGPDDMLYVSTGDGGGNGASGNSQDLSNLLGSLLRLDVRDSASSLIPPDNPFVSIPGARGETFAYGLRNPFRFSFDRVTGDLYIGDVGQSSREEIDRIDAGSSGGMNFGWPICEGSIDFEGDCASSGTTLPVLEYAHNGGSSAVTGGYVYRGSDFPELVGAYIYSDSYINTVWAWDRDPASAPVVIATDSFFITSWGESTDGELFALGASGRIRRLERTAPPAGNPSFPTLLSETGLFQDTANLTVAPGLVPYGVTAPLWSDNAIKQRWIALPADRKIAFRADGQWDFPFGTALVKNFELPLVGGGTRRVETRIYVRQLDDWAGVTYRWNSAQDDAVLLTDGLVESIDLGGSFQDWKYPSPAECAGCHSLAAGRVLGARTNQLGEAYDYDGTLQNQLEALDCAGLFDHLIGSPSLYTLKSAIDDVSIDPTHRARSYIDTNCAVCHQPFGAGNGSLDLRFETAVGDWNAVGVPPQFGDLGLFSPLLIEPGVSSQSVLVQRQDLVDPLMRMARGTLETDTAGFSFLETWVDTNLGTIDTDLDGFTDDTDVCPSVPDPLQTDSDFDGIGDACDVNVLADLSVSYYFVPQAANEGDTVVMLGNGTNHGASPSESFPLTFYLSEDSTFDPALDPAAGGCWIGPLGPSSSGQCYVGDGRIPLDLVASGETLQNFNWFVCANRSGVSPDADDTNACVLANTQISVPEPGVSVALRSIAWLIAAGCAARAPRRRHATDQRPRAGRDQ